MSGAQFLFAASMILVVGLLGLNVLWWHRFRDYPVKSTLRCTIASAITLLGTAWLSTISFKFDATIRFGSILIGPMTYTSGESTMIYMSAAMALTFIATTCLILVGVLKAE
jgi:hypothetical protein